jgi:hypothetical protein
VVQKLPLLEGLGMSHALLKALPTEVKVSGNFQFSVPSSQMKMLTINLNA